MDTKKETEEVEVEVDENENDNQEVTFQDLGLRDQLCEACAQMGFKKPSKIQREAIPWAIKGRDIIGLAQTGSGKTAAFGLPILHELLENPQPFFACIIAPTRELAIQIAKHLEGLGSTIGVKCAVTVGGIDTMSQAIALAKKPHIIVGTPGRIVWHLENTKGFTMKNLKFLVLDEADRLLSLDFEEEINKMLTMIPKNRHTYLFSATMTSKVEKLQRASLVNPVRVEVNSKYTTVDRLIQHYLFIPAKYKDCYLAFILNEFSGNTVMVFAATRKETQRLAILLRNLGFGAIPLHGLLTQQQRLASLNKFTAGERNVLIATDVASRGLDIPTVDLVINYDMPGNSKDYIHRVGRTARGDRSGRAISLVTQYDVELYQRIEHLIGKQLDRFPVEEEEALILLERVNEAQRLASIEMREQGLDKKGEDDDEEEDVTVVKKRKGPNQKTEAKLKFKKKKRN